MADAGTDDANGANDDNDDSGAAAVGIDPANQPKPIASVSGTTARVEGIKSLTVELLELRRRDKVLYGSFRVTANGDYEGAKQLYELFGVGLHWLPGLIDTSNLKMYEAISETTSSMLVELRSNQPAYIHSAWAYPEGAKSVDIEITSGLPIMHGVTVP